MTPKKQATVVMEQNILNSDNEQLVELINSLVNTKQDELFTKYKAKAESQLESDHELIESLQAELKAKDDKIEALLEELSSLKQDSSMEFASPIRKKASGRLSQDELAKERQNICFTLDMIELLTGVKVINFENNSEEYIFDIKQSSSVRSGLTMYYQLVLASSPNPEINYIPTFLDALEGEEVEDYENAKILQKLLPDYLCENLSFPFDTLAQFYGKVNRALNRK
ncbi:conserved hypothetical protein [Candida dubliniensis CD36]|uniref:Monopolin complex subunit Csm1/Pcs1 C-terminal domain-containing protein n=1 Tax=Candida dubliniensis (strain CD36 / ATCC MYA-646 / CBS 7987 / NCPF 3949 / NRRL Y-17841) TaxID=573826 RepID=B9WN70_CANDC|nr:conserved hypothetical protein [Candida dubliniensis CD36]CAX40537.1 conserved hypothetical protein [Candida dubliniensis CD36]